MTSDNPTLDQQFQAATALVDNLPANTAPALMTDLYGLYKQATEGDHDMPKGEVAADEAEKPSGPAGLSQAQWDSWSKCKGMSQEEAKRQYVRHASAAGGPQPSGGTSGGGLATDARTGAPTSNTAPGGLHGDLTAGAPYGGEDKLKGQS